MSKSTKPLVSIIMAAKDTAPYLKVCIDSILAQTYPNWELIAVNDHSTDETPEILTHYAQSDNRIRVFHSNRPKLIPTLKEGYPRAKGMLINRMDSDDLMPLDKLEALVNEWLKYGKGHVVAGGTRHFVDEGEVGGGFLRYEEWLNDVARTQTHWQQIYQECVIPSHCWLMHRDDFEAVGGFEPEIYPEDYDLCFRMYKHGLKVIGLDKILHYWRDRSNRISRTWHEYKDNRYFDMKLHYFYQIDRRTNRPLVIWGAGRNGKDLVKRVLDYEPNILWVCDNERKIGQDVYGIIMQSYNDIVDMESPQLLIAVTSPIEKLLIRRQLDEWGKRPVQDYWFFI